MTSVDTRTTRAAATATFVVFGGNGLVFRLGGGGGGLDFGAL